MEAPTLSEKQKNKTLSAKKEKKVKKNPSKVVRTVLCCNIPQTKYQLSVEECTEFGKKLNEIFKYTPPIVPNWSTLKKIPKEERKKVRLSLTKRQEKHPSSQYLIFGINAVTKSLEKKTTSAVILSTDITPKILTKHIYDSCNLYEIPLREITNLRSISKLCFGFPSIAIAFKKEIPTNDPVFDIERFLTSKCLYQNIDSKIPIYNMLTANNNNNKEDCEEQESKIDFNYLYKNSDERCFVPPKKEKKTEDLTFISLDETIEPVVEQQNLLIYNNLKVKKIQGSNGKRKQNNKKLLTNKKIKQ